MDKQSQAKQSVWDEIAYPFLDFNVWEEISSFIPYFMMGVNDFECNTKIYQSIFFYSTESYFKKV